MNPKLLRAAAAATLALAAASAQAFCGFFAGRADASLFNEASQVILARDGPRTVITMLNDFRGAAADFALVVPVPQVLQREQVRVVEPGVFARIDAFSAPRLAEYFDPDPCPMHMPVALEMQRMPMAAAAPAPSAKAVRDERARALGVAVEAAYAVGEYDIVMLSAKQSAGLETWLLENGYRMPKGAAAALKPYVAQDMKFFVAKVNLKAQAASGTRMLRPLQFAFESERFMLPLRLGMINAEPDKAQDLIVYVLTRQGRVESSNYRTVKLPTDVNLPVGVKREFKHFYKSMFEHSARKEEHRVVFTEYFWDMSWCDPCAADPLNAQELGQAGVFWLDEPAAAPQRRRPGFVPMPGPVGGAAEAMLTRLHVRYTPATFAEDLMLVQTKDRQNWQTRYVLQHAHESTLAQCRAKASARDCEAACERSNTWRGGNPAACVAQCKASTEAAVQQARRYVEEHLPQRRQQEARTLAQLTGWGAEELRRVAGVEQQPAAEPERWWLRLFGTPASGVRP